jgi:DNA invertase Pin-like site-specific DNA recombinase
MKTYGYCRVSTDRQSKEGESLQVQERMIEGYAHMHNITWEKNFVEEGISGSVPFFDRPQGKILRQLLKAGDTIITPKLDRMFRSALDALLTLNYFQKEKIHLHILDFGGDVTNNGISKFMFTMLSAFAEMERERIRERIKDVKKDQKSRGKYLGGTIPFGHTVVDKMLIPIGATADFKKLRQAGYSLRDIAKQTGLSHSGVRKILNRA